MARLIPQNFIDDLLDRVDIVDIIDSRVKLKKTGKNYSACCPFHNENTPSFSVSPDKQFYHCFGCGASGNAVKFIMEYDGSSFPDTIDQLAATVGLTVPKDEASKEEIEQQQLQRPLFGLMQKASEYYEQMLRQHQDKQKPIGYLQDRGLSGQAAKFFGIGYAPAGWDNLLQTLVVDDDKKTIQQLISCGMLVEREDGRCYDRFRDRIMFPIRDIRGRVIAFGGRVLGDEKPKYLNSPETPIFHKGKELYGLYEARKIRQKLTRFVVVEGYMDVVALAENGIHYAVATLGTSTSEHHLRRLFKMVPEIVFCFDGDDAGRTAAARAMEMVLPILTDGLQVRFLFLPDGEDPDSLIRKIGKDAFEQRLNNATDLPEFLFDHLKAQIDFDSLQGKARFDQLAAPLIAKIPQGTLRNLMVQQLEVEIGTASSAIQQIEQPQIVSITSQAEPVLDNLPPPPVFDEQPSNDLSVLAQKALACLVQAPHLAQGLALPEPDGSAESIDEFRLLEVLKKLKDSPQNSTISLLILCTGLPYLDELKKLAEQQSIVSPSVGDIESVLQLINSRKLQAELNILDQRFLAGEKLNQEERTRQRELKLLLHNINKKRGR